MGPIGAQNGAKGPLGEPKRVPKGTLEAKGAQRWTLGAPEGANGNVGHPFVRPRGAQGDPRREDLISDGFGTLKGQIIRTPKFGTCLA